MDTPNHPLGIPLCWLERGCKSSGYRPPGEVGQSLAEELHRPGLWFSQALVMEKGWDGPHRGSPRTGSYLLILLGLPQPAALGNLEDTQGDEGGQASQSILPQALHFLRLHAKLQQCQIPRVRNWHFPHKNVLHTHKNFPYNIRGPGTPRI